MSALTMVLQTALATGVDFCEVFLEHSHLRRFQVDSEEAPRSEEYPLEGVGIRVRLGDAQGYAATNNPSEVGMLRCLLKAVDKLQIRAAKRLAAFPGLNNRIDYAIVPMERSLSSREIGACLIEQYNRLRPYQNPLLDAVLLYQDRQQEVEIANTEGVWATETRFTAGISLEFHERDRRRGMLVERSLGWSGDPGRLAECDLSMLGQEGFATVQDQSYACAAPQGSYPVILGNGYGGIFLHEACGHLLEGQIICRVGSPFAELLGSVVGTPLLNVWDDPTLDGLFGTRQIDDEGTPTRPVPLIVEGKLVSFLSDNTTASRWGSVSSGSARRQDFRYPPAPRMSNTYLAPGLHRPAELIQSVDEGLYVQRLGRGKVDHHTGTFCLEVREGRWISHGQMKRAVHPLWIRGTAREALSQLSMVADNLEFGSAYCRSFSGDLSVTVGQPDILLESLELSSSIAESTFADLNV